MHAEEKAYGEEKSQHNSAEFSSSGFVRQRVWQPENIYLLVTILERVTIQ